MSSYVEDVLTPGERVVHLGHVSLWSLFGWIAVGTVLLPAFGLGLILWGVAWVKYRTTEIALTNRRVIVKKGFVSRQTVEINLAKVESIQVDQSMLGRVLNYGSLVIAGGGIPQAPVSGISDPIAFRRAFVQAQDEKPAPAVPG